MGLQPVNFRGLIGKEPNYQAPNKPAQRVEVPEIAGRLVDRLFINLKAFSPAWKQAFETDNDYNETKQIWLQTLVAQGVCNAKALKRGLAKAAESQSPFFPSVGQFVAWCREEDYAAMGLPHPDELIPRWQRFIGRLQIEFKSAAEYWLFKEISHRYGLRHEKYLEDGAQKVLAEAVKKVKSGFEFPPIPLRIEQKPQVINYEKNLAHIAKLKAMLGLGWKQ